MAPALIIGFRGRPVVGSRLIALKASPEGSTWQFFEHPLSAEQLQGQAVGKGLGDRLDSERLAGIAHLVDAAIGRGECDAEVRRIGLGELGNAVGRRAVVERLVTLMEFLQQPLDHVGCRGC
jgi:hypothetical protein